MTDDSSLQNLEGEKFDTRSSTESNAELLLLLLSRREGA